MGYVSDHVWLLLAKTNGWNQETHFDFDAL